MSLNAEPWGMGALSPDKKREIERRIEAIFYSAPEKSCGEIQYKM